MTSKTIRDAFDARAETYSADRIHSFNDALVFGIGTKPARGSAS